MHFVPPFPPRPPKVLPPLRLLRLARRNLVAIWPIDTFSRDFFGHTLLRQSVFVCNSPTTVKQVFVDDAANFHVKSPQQRHALKPLIGDGLFISDGKVWRERRDRVAPLTHISRLPELSRVMTLVAAERAAIWQSSAGSEIDVLAEMAAMTASIICRALFGSSLGAQAIEDVVGGFSEFQTRIGQMDLISLFGLPDFLPRWHGARVRRSAIRIRTVMDELLSRILTERADGEASLVRSMAAEQGGGLDPAAIRNEAAVLFMAGHETTANTLSWAWYLLSQDSETEARLHVEVDALDGRPATYSDLPGLRFTRAVIEETLRLFPPVPIQARVAAQARRIEGRDVPAGAVVMLVPWLLHRHRNYWAEPDSFVPDRFMPGGKTPNRYAYVPFSVGPRICTGAAFGLTEAILCLATIAQQFRLRLRDDWTVMPICRLSLRPGDRLPMRLIARRAA
jgi:cytochrome P450